MNYAYVGSFLNVIIGKGGVMLQCNCLAYVPKQGRTKQVTGELKRRAGPDADHFSRNVVPSALDSMCLLRGYCT